MILGRTICVVGAGLIICLDLGPTTLLWASYLVVTGMGMGMSIQLPYTALQVVLRKVAQLSPLHKPFYRLLLTQFIKGE